MRKHGPSPVPLLSMVQHGEGQGDECSPWACLLAWGALDRRSLRPHRLWARGDGERSLGVEEKGPSGEKGLLVPLPFPRMRSGQVGLR